MANEYFRRTPTSSGNRSTHTWSGWIKRNVLGDWTRLFSTAGQTLLQLTGSSPPDQIRYLDQTGSNYDLRSTSLLRDVGNWMHIVLSVDHTLSVPRDRVRIYVNGVELDNYSTDSSSNGTQNLETFFNSITEHGLLGRETVNTGENFKGEAFDVFWVDGQALTPDVFGFYKDGDGYQSSGTTKATDFRPGQWSPRLPKSIKYTINRSGGFGVNGFYLPMNDSSNPGADFHCDPNSIIKLKGEDLPQPRNGAPTTTDAYVSELRSDPFAANIVLAVPGIALENTNTELVTNGTFDSDNSSWNGTGISELHNSFTTSQSGGYLIVNSNTNSGSTYGVSQDVTTVNGTRYTLSFDIVGGTGNGRIRVENGSSGSNVRPTVSGLGVGSHSFSFIAGDQAFSRVFLGRDSSTNGGTNATVHYDNISVKEAIPVRDYSADIKGSGTNKTLTANGNAGVGYEIPGYYGSAMTFDGSGDYLEVDTPVLGSGDWTIEEWFKQEPGTTMQTYWDVSLGVNGDSNSENGASIYHSTGAGGFATGEVVFISAASGGYRIYGGQDLRDGCWHHVVVEKYNNRVTLYVDGVAKDGEADTANYNSTSNTRIGLGLLAQTNYFEGEIQDVRVYVGVAKYKGGFDVPKPYTPVGIESWRTTTDTCKNNFATLNPLIKSVFSSGDRTISNGNLTATTISTGAANGLRSTIATNSGKWYVEVYVSETTISTVGFIGVTGISEIDNQNSDTAGDHIYYYGTAQKYDYVSGTLTSSSYGSTYTAGDIISVLINADNGEVTFYKNNVSQGVAKTFPASKFPLVLQIMDGGSNATATYHVNFGQNPSFSGLITAGTNADDSGKGLFKYAPPSGFLALCEDNLPAPAIADPGKHFKCVLWTGSGGSKAITGVGFKPDLVWVKSRTNTEGHILFDSVRGPNVRQLVHTNTVEGTAVGGLDSFDGDGFSVGAYTGTNQSGQDYVAWCWKAGGAAVSNTDGTITSQVSVNQTAGFSVGTFSGNLQANQSIGHGLGKVPAMVVVKERNANSGWAVYHKARGNTKVSYWDLPSTEFTETGNGASWGPTDPTSDVFYVGANGATNDNNLAFYAWAEIEGFSKFGSYIGNNDPDGPAIFCGFKPAFLMIKLVTGSARDWHIYDSSRNPTNPVGLNLRPSNDAGDIDEPGIDFLSNGFKIRQNYVFSNENTQTIIFAAFAESPFQTANAK